MLSLIRQKWHPRPTGHFDGRRGDCVGGWLLDAAQPERRLWVRLEGGGVSMPLLADQYRPDLRKAGYGDGYHGFSVPLRKFGEGATLRAFSMESGRELYGSPRRAAAQPASAWRGRAGALRVVVDDFAPADGRISGYVVDPEAPGRRPQLVLQRGERTLDQARACLYRADALQAGGDGFNGFVLHAGTGGGADGIRVVAPALGLVLAMAPRSRR